jgi:hypothetical protein
MQPETLTCSSTSLGLDSWPPNNPQIQTRSSRAVFEGSTQGNLAPYLYIIIKLAPKKCRESYKIIFYKSEIMKKMLVFLMISLNRETVERHVQDYHII